MDFQAHAERYGINPSSYNLAVINDMATYGVGDKMQGQMVRTMAEMGTSNVHGMMQDRMNRYVNAGLQGPEGIAARPAYNEAAAGTIEKRGGRAADVADAGLALSIGASTPGFNKTAAVEQGTANYETSQNLLNGGSSGLDTIMISKLRSLGVTNAVDIAMFMKLGLDNPTTQQYIAKYTGKTVEVVRKALVGGVDSYGSMIDSVVGKGSRFNKATGGDRNSLMLGGVKQFDLTVKNSKGEHGATVQQSMHAQFAPGAGKGPEQVVTPGATTGKDVENAGQAGTQVATDTTMQGMLTTTGKSVTDAMVAAIQKGWAVGADEIRKAGVELSKGATKNHVNPQSGQQSFGGTKGQKAQ
jgi:hypothetical protein